MSQHIPHFLTRLALDLDADAKTIRRAYARELKLIDQEHDLPGFQLLREAYENALEWARYERAAPATASQGPVALTPLVLAPVCARVQAPALAVPSVDPHALAAAVFDRLVVNIRRIVSLGLLKDPELLEAELRHRLADDELLNITARSLFEARVAHLLLDDWTVEAGILFGAAATVFGWEKDSRRLQQLGHAGALIDRAIEERTMFRAQNQDDLTKQRSVMLRLRQPKAPGIVQIRRDMPYVERMITRFPNLLAIMVSREMVEQWRTLADEPVHRNAPLDTTPEPVLGGHSAKRSFDGAWIFFALIIAVYAAIGYSGRDRQSSYHASASTDSWPDPVYAPGADPLAPDYIPPVPGVALARYATAAPGARQLIIDAIAADIQYKPASRAPKGKRTVVFDVFAGANGEIFGMNRMQRSIDPAFDDAVRAAIMRAKPLAPEVGTNVRMHFSQEWRWRPAHPKPSAAKEQAGAAKLRAAAPKLSEQQSPQVGTVSE